MSIFCDNFFDQYDQRAKAIVAKMTQEEKIGQMILPTFDLLTNQKGSDAMAKAKKAWPNETDENLWKILGFDAIKKYHLGAALQPANPISYSGESQGEDAWQKLTRISNLHYSGPDNIPFIIGNDAIHGDQHVTGRILFPHNIGLGATHNPALIKQIATDTMLNLLQSGFNWSFTPAVAIGYDFRWGRFYESFGSDLAVIKELTKNYVEGLQAIKNNNITGVLATAKHFIGDGDTKDGMDQGYTSASSLKETWEKNGIGYEGAVLANVATIMASYSSLNDIPMHFGGDFNILSRFRNEGIKGSDGKDYQLGGFVVSDFIGVSRAAYKYNLLHEKKIDFTQAIAKSINAGIDMFMLANEAYLDPFDYDKNPHHEIHCPLCYSHISTVIDAIASTVSRGLVTQARIDDAVVRIIRTKLALHSRSGKAPAPDQAKHSLSAAEQSLVLLKNKKKKIPFNKDTIDHVFFLGDYNDIGSQNGGWTINWQGQKGNKYWQKNSANKKRAHATSIIDGIDIALKARAPKYYEGEDAIFDQDLSNVKKGNSVAIVVIAEYPYAEYNGDVANKNPWYYRGAVMEENPYTTSVQRTFLGMHFTPKQIQAIKRLKQLKVPIVTILLSGRPLVITEGKDAPLHMSDSFIAAFLPGTSGGEAIANAIFGTYTFKSVKNQINGKTYFSNTLPFAWPASMDEVIKKEATLFPVGYGLP